MRGVLAPASAKPKAVLEDVIDFLELSDAKMDRETRMRIAKADREGSWLPLSGVGAKRKR